MECRVNRRIGPFRCSHALLPATNWMMACMMSARWLMYFHHGPKCMRIANATYNIAANSVAQYPNQMLWVVGVGMAVLWSPDVSVGCRWWWEMHWFVRAAKNDDDWATPPYKRVLLMLFRHSIKKEEMNTQHYDL